MKSCFINELVNSKTFSFLKKWRITLIFGFFYVFVNLMFYRLNGDVYPTNHLYTFLTTWFNWAENWDYGNVSYGFIENFGLPLFFIWMAEYYARNIQQDPTKNYLSIDSIFAMGVIATYIMTGLDWYFLSQNIKGFFTLGSGSSIVAFTLFMTYLPILIIDSVLMIRSHSFGSNIMSSTKRLLTFVLLCCLVVFGVVQDSSDMNHRVGFGIFSLFAITLMVSRYNACYKLDS